MENTVSENKYTIEFILSQMIKLQEQTEYLNDAFAKLADIPVGQGPGDVAGQAKAQALGDIVRCRETTNQKLLSLYERMYSDLQKKEKTEIIKQAFSTLTDTFETTLDLHSFDEDEQRVEALTTIYDSIGLRITGLVQELLK